MNPRILVVDDDPTVLASIRLVLGGRFAFETATSGAEALTRITSQGPYAVVLADMQMANMSGLELLIQVESLAPDTIRVMLTGNVDQSTAVDAVNRGHVFRLLRKPCGPEALIRTLEAGLKQYALVTAERELLERTLNGTIRLLTEALAGTHPEAFGRCEKLRDDVRAYARSVQLERTWDLEAAALLLLVGYLSMPASLIEKAASNQSLSESELALISRLPEIGASLLGHVPRLEPVAAIVRYQNKFHDGRGFPPDDVAGERIPAGARILKVLRDLADCESGGMPRAEALAAMSERVGEYDPQVLANAAHCFDGQAPSDVVVHSRISSTLRDLSVGQVLVDDVRTKEGILVVCAGTKLTAMVLQRLRNFAELNPVREPILVEGQSLINDRPVPRE